MRPPVRAIASLDLPPRQDGGIATLVDVLATGLSEIGQPAVVYARGRGREEKAWDAARAYPVVRMRGHSWIRHSSRNFMPYIFQMIWRYRPAVLYAASWQLAGRPAALARRLGCRVEVLAYGRDVTAREELPGALRSADRIVALTRWLAGEIVDRGADPTRVRVVHPAVHPPREAGDPSLLRRRLGLDADAPLVLTVARLVPRKGHDVLLEAFAAVLRRHPRAALLIVGQGPRREAIERSVRAAGLGSRVRLAGYLDGEALETAYRAARVFALPCREERGGDTEGFGLVFLEAGARGLPVVAGRTGGVPEAVLDGETGLLVPPTHPAEVARALIDLLSSPERAREMGSAGRSLVRDRFLPRHYARRLVEEAP